jgi:hypothetical protein
MQITKIESVLIHVSEFGSWVTCGKLNLDLRRIVAMKEGDSFSFFQILDAYGNIRLSEPEAYIIASLKDGWRQSIQKPSISFIGSKASLGLDSVLSFHALTRDAQLRLNPQTERLSISLSPPDFETLWQDFQNQSQYHEIRESGLTFLGLYSFPNGTNPRNLEISDLLLKKLLTRVSEYKSERTLESLKGLAEYGPTEFGIRISAEYGDEWRKNDERYKRFREIRFQKLSKKSWNEINYLEFPDLLESILSFDEESRTILGIPPLAAISFFISHAEFVLQGNKLNLDSINRSASYMLSLGYDDDCFNYLYVIGCAIGSEQVAGIKYRYFKENFSVFNKNLSYKSDEKYNEDIFKINRIPAISQAQSGNPDVILTNSISGSLNKADDKDLSIAATSVGQQSLLTESQESDVKDILQGSATIDSGQFKISEANLINSSSGSLDKNIDKRIETTGKSDLNSYPLIPLPPVGVSENDSASEIRASAAVDVEQDSYTKSTEPSNKNSSKKNSDRLSKAKEIKSNGTKEELGIKSKARTSKK